MKRRAKRDFLALPSPSHSTAAGGGQKSGRSRAARRSKSIVLNDPRWPAMWYLVSTKAFVHTTFYTIRCERFINIQVIKYRYLPPGGIINMK